MRVGPLTSCAPEAKPPPDMAPGLHHTAVRGCWRAASQHDSRHRQVTCNAQDLRRPTRLLCSSAGRYHASKAEAESKLPFDAGFEAVGVIAEVGEGVNGRSGVSGACTLSGAGQFVTCERPIFSIYIYNLPCWHCVPVWMAPCFADQSDCRVPLVSNWSIRREQCVEGTRWSQESWACHTAVVSTCVHMTSRIDNLESVLSINGME